MPTLLGFNYNGVYMGYPYPYFCLCAFLGPYTVVDTSDPLVLGWNHGPLLWALKPGILIYLIYTRFVPFKVPSKG